MYIIINEYPPMIRLSLLMFLFKVPRQCSVQYKYDSCHMQPTELSHKDRGRRRARIIKEDNQQRNKSEPKIIACIREIEPTGGKLEPEIGF